MIIKSFHRILLLLVSTTAINGYYQNYDRNSLYLPDYQYSYIDQLKMVISQATECQYKTNGYSSCTPDCRSRIICANGNNYSTPCPSGQYCNSDTLACQSAPTACIYNSTLQVGVDPINFDQCTVPFTPDLINCRQFRYCLDSYFYEYACLNNSVYDPVQTICRGQATCYSFSNTSLCSGKLNQLVAYPPDNTSYVYCGAGNVPVWQKCPPGSADLPRIFNPTSKSCEITCVKEGRFLDPDDTGSATSYYECYKNGTKMATYKRICAEETTFNPELTICTLKPIYSVCNNSVFAEFCQYIGVYRITDPVTRPNILVPPGYIVYCEILPTKKYEAYICYTDQVLITNCQLNLDILSTYLTDCNKPVGCSQYDFFFDCVVPAP